MGIGKRQLLEDYYFDEIGEIIHQWNALYQGEEEEDQVDALTFFGEGGEMVGVG